MKTAKDYPVTFPYGATSYPYSPSHPHLGDDQAMPTGTPVVVNGQTIALSGNTGKSTGPHVHTQKVQNGQVVKPTGGGYDVPPPVTVVAEGEQSDIGIYVRYKDGNGVIWSKFHLSEVKVKTGEHIGGEDMTMNREDAIWYWRVVRYKHSPTDSEKKALTGKDFSKVASAEYETEAFKKRQEAVQNYDKVVAENQALKKQLADLQGTYEPVGQLYIKKG